MRVMCVVGARPNFMKIKPVVDALESRGVETSIVHTGQHYDNNMSEVFFEELGIRPPDISLEVGSGTQAEQTSLVMTRLEPVTADLDPDIVVVVGDVNSTLAAALVAAKSPARLAHVEAGLRSRDWTMPEEINRVVTDRVSDYLLAPSQDAVENLVAEGCSRDSIGLVGNVMIDTLLANVARAQERSTLRQIGVENTPYVAVTLHRPNNVDDPAHLAGLVDALGSLAGEIPVVFPLHPRTRARLIPDDLAGGLIYLDPLGYLDFVALEASAALVITDSGGVQEETTALGIPCLTVRDNTERPITITEGTNQLVGRDPRRLLEAARAVLNDPPSPRKPDLWDGQAAERIADFLLTEASEARLV